MLLRRSNSYEYLEKYEEALEDLKEIQKIDASYPKINDLIAKLQKKCDEKLNKLKDEALGSYSLYISTLYRLSYRKSNCIFRKIERLRKFDIGQFWYVP